MTTYQYIRLESSIDPPKIWEIYFPCLKWDILIHNQKINMDPG